MKIGVFDSGRGGEAVAARLRELLPSADVISINDHDNVPYGNRSADEVFHLTAAAISPLLEAHCDAIIIACNTATTLAITTLRETYPDMPFVGIEPMVKPASLVTKTGVIAVFATPGTLGSDRYRELKQEFGAHRTFIEPDVSEWASLIEQDAADQVPVESSVKEVIAQNADVIVLACTHYHWLKDRISAVISDDVTVLEPSDAISVRIKDLLALT